MAIMYPEEIVSNPGATEGERKVFRFIKAAARPDKEFLCCFEPHIGYQGKTPDFILLDKNQGLIIIEVKDWTIHQIRGFNTDQFIVHISGIDDQRTNPDKQAKGYVNTLKEKLQSIPDFFSDAPDFHGKLKIPIGRMVAFPNIRRQEYLEREPLSQLIPPERILLQEDLDPIGEILSDPSGKKFQERIARVFLFRLRVALTDSEIDKLKNIVWPEIIHLPERQGTDKTLFKREVMALDESQARLAKNLGCGHQIIKGPPGSGKTLILVHRCCQLVRYGHKGQRILFICFNIAFTSYLKRLLQEKEIGIGEGGIEVYHFYELCSKILGLPIEFNKPDSKYYQAIVHETLNAVQTGQHDFGNADAILIDEGQDFSDDMLKITMELLNPNDNLIIAFDSYQDLYIRNTSWKSLGIDARGRTHYIGNVYRSTIEIFEFTQRFLGAKIPGQAKTMMLPLNCFSHGKQPSLIHFRDLEEIVNFLAEDIKKQVTSGEYKRSEIAVIYDDKTYEPEDFKYASRDLPTKIQGKLENKGIPVKWISEDVRAKELFDITSDRVTLISIHSSKGLDFDFVYLVGIDRIVPTKETHDYLKRLLYVALTRAKYRLVIPYIEGTEFIKEMFQCLKLTK